MFQSLVQLSSNLSRLGICTPLVGKKLKFVTSFSNRVSCSTLEFLYNATISKNKRSPHTAVNKYPSLHLRETWILGFRLRKLPNKRQRKKESDINNLYTEFTFKRECWFKKSGSYIVTGSRVVAGIDRLTIVSLDQSAVYNEPKYPRLRLSCCHKLLTISQLPSSS